MEETESPSSSILEDGRQYIEEVLLDMPDLEAEGALINYFDSNKIRGEKKNYLKAYYKSRRKEAKVVAKTSDFSKFINGATEDERFTCIKDSIKSVWLTCEESLALTFIDDVCKTESYSEEKKNLLIDFYKNERKNKAEEKVDENAEPKSLYTDEFINDEVKQNWNSYLMPQAKSGEYVISDYGILRIEKRGEDKPPIAHDVCRTPFVLCGISEPINGSELYYKVRFKSFNHEVKEFWSKQTTLVTKSDIRKEFNGRGINLPEGKLIDEAIEYISLSISEFGNRYRKEFSTSRCGWTDDKTKFVLGNRVITAQGIEAVLIVGSGFEELTPKGDLPTWVDAVQPILKHELARFKFYDAFTACINFLLDVESHMTDHYGDTSEGKTLTAKIAMSGAGNPNEGIACRADSTAKSILTNIGKHSDIPFLIDETGMAKEDFPTVVYGVTNELGRTKLNKDGDLIPGDKYRSTTLLTGENSLRDVLKFSGQMLRVIEINETIPYIAPETVEKAYTVLKENYGHVIESYMQKVFEFKEDGSLKDLFNECLSTLPVTETKVEGRQKRTFACIMAAGYILEQVFEEIGIESADPGLIVSNYFCKCVSEKPIEMEHIRALRVIFDWVQSDYGSFTYCTSDDCQLEGNGFQRNGYIDDMHIDIIGTNFSKKLEEHHLKPTKIKERLAAEGLIAPKVKKNWQFYREGKSINGVRIFRGFAEEALGMHIEKVEVTQPFINEEAAILDIVRCLTRVKGCAEKKLIDLIADTIDTDYVLNLLVNEKKIEKIDENSWCSK